MAGWVPSSIAIETIIATAPTTTTRQTSNVTTVMPIVPPVGEGQGSRAVRRRWWIALLAVAMVLAGLVAASLVPVPYYSLSPGRPVPAAPLVSVPDDLEVDADGEIYLTTVLQGRASALEAVIGWLRPTVDIVPEQVVLPPDIPPERLREVNLDLMAGSKQAALGVAFEALGFDAIQGTGAAVVQVLEGTAADGVLEGGDTIVEVAGEPIGVSSEVSGVLGERGPGTTVAMVVEDGEGVERTVSLTLGANPDAPDRAFLGVLLQTRDLTLDFPFEVTIDSEEIGGPSAGLAFTLEVLDRLTEGDLTGGMDVAATGEIGLDGRVGPIGAAAQKGAAVADAGIELFLVPRANAEAARLHTGDRVAVVAVDTLDDALAALEAAGGDPLGRLLTEVPAA